VTSFTPSGARRSGDEYQDLHSAEVLIEWLENPEAYLWIRLETADGSLDDIQAQRADGTRRLLQVKFATDVSSEWDWDDLTHRESGRTGEKPSLLQKWKTSLDKELASSAASIEAALLTNRRSSSAIRAHINDAGLVDFGALSAPLSATLSAQLGGPDAAAAFFARFHFTFSERSALVLEQALRERFRRLGGTDEGWHSLLERIRRWINRNDEPSADGLIGLADVRSAARWHLPPTIPQAFLIPHDYVAPKDWSETTVEPLLRSQDLLVVTGSPGAGKSTYLSWLVRRLQEADVPVIRHHYFLSLTDDTSYRTGWESAASALIAQLQLAHATLVRSAGQQNPVPGKLRDFLAAAGTARSGKPPLVVVVDGLDHVWRDTGSADGLRRFFDLLLPTPPGVVIVVGTQDIETAKLPLKLRDLCPRQRWLEVPTLSSTDTRDWLQFHRLEWGLAEGDVHCDRLFGELAEALHEVSGGHPLALHYTFSAVLGKGPRPQPGDIRAQRHFDPKSNIAAYYSSLWHDITSEGHQLLHLLAGFRWAWPRDALVECLVAQADSARLEVAERAVRHVLGTSRVGVTAFHESLLAFIRTLHDHEAVVGSLRPRVLDWLARRAPERWRWQHEWIERAAGGDKTSLLDGPTPYWCIDSLLAGRTRREISDIVAASGRAALEEGRLGVATTRHLLDAYLEDAARTEGILPRLLRLAMNERDSRSRTQELDAFLSHKSHLSEEELQALAEVAFASGESDICEELLEEAYERWNAAVGRPDDKRPQLTSLQDCVPFLMAGSLAASSDSSYRRFISKHHREPAWCTTGRYVQALARCCALGGDTSAVRDELRFIANSTVPESSLAVDVVVRLGCREGFDPASWLDTVDSRRSGLFLSHQAMTHPARDFSSSRPDGISFEEATSVAYEEGESVFAELARSYFFACLASSLAEHEPPSVRDLEARARLAADFLTSLEAIAADAAKAHRAGTQIGAAWFVTGVTESPTPDVRMNDLGANRFLRPGSLARIVTAIAFDLEDLLLSQGRPPSLMSETLARAIDSGWTSGGAWIADRVRRHLPFVDGTAARFASDRERLRLATGRDALPTRASDYVLLADFAKLHGAPAEDVRELSRLAARHLLGHGYHKDLVLSDVLAAIQLAHRSGDPRTLTRLRVVSPTIQVIMDITDGDETRHLQRELADVLAKVAFDVLPAYMRALQRQQNDWQVEEAYTDLAGSISFSSPYEKALGGTLVHEPALAELSRRAASGDTAASSVLSETLAYCGRVQIAASEPESGSPGNATRSVSEGENRPLPAPEAYPPDRLTEFVRQLRDVAHVYGHEALAEWTLHWRAKDPGALLTALTRYRSETGRPLETQTATTIVALALERRGLACAWEWTVAYHNAMYAWNSYFVRLRDVEPLWDFVRARFHGRWLDFIVATFSPDERRGSRAPGWSTERMVRFLQIVGAADRIDEVVDAAVDWAARLTADMQLPDAALERTNAGEPPALALLVDRLDCPSRMVQERAAWWLARLLADTSTSEVVSLALLAWHRKDNIELRSCTLLLVLALAKTVHDFPAESCVEIAGRAALAPSIAAKEIASEWGAMGGELASSIRTVSSHSGLPREGFTGICTFRDAVESRLAPIFSVWADSLEDAGADFWRQWQWEASSVGERLGVAIPAGRWAPSHYDGGADGPALAISDRVSVVLRSAYVRALQWAVEKGSIEGERANSHARWTCTMADPICWSVRPSAPPPWWPRDTGEANDVDALGGVIGDAERYLASQKASDEVLVYAAGPIGNRPFFRAELTIQAFLQAAEGPGEPAPEEVALQTTPLCYLLPSRVSLGGTYIQGEGHVTRLEDWTLAPLACRVEKHTIDWLLPQRQTRGLFVPPPWIIPDTPTIGTSESEVHVVAGGRRVARYQYWHDDFRERLHHGAGPRVGAVLLIERHLLERELARGASLCWIATLSVAQRKEHRALFGNHRIVGSRLIGGSSVVRATPWRLQSSRR
jgi:hypothetical protein